MQTHSIYDAYLQFVYFEEREVPVIPVERSPSPLSSSWDSCQGHLWLDQTFKIPSHVQVGKIQQTKLVTEGKGFGGVDWPRGRVCLSGSPPRMGKRTWFPTKSGLRNLTCGHEAPEDMTVSSGTQCDMPACSVACTVYGWPFLHKTFFILRHLWKRRTLPVNSTGQYVNLLCTRLLQWQFANDGWAERRREALPGAEQQWIEGLFGSACKNTPQFG